MYAAYFCVLQVSLRCQPVLSVCHSVVTDKLKFHSTSVSRGQASVWAWRLLRVFVALANDQMACDVNSLTRSVGWKWIICASGQSENKELKVSSRCSKSYTLGETFVLCLDVVLLHIWSVLLLCGLDMNLSSSAMKYLKQPRCVLQTQDKHITLRSDIMAVSDSTLSTNTSSLRY